MKESKVGKGRVGVYVPNHPAANNRGYILRYRYVMEEYLGRYLDSEEQVHHCNKNKTDDYIENLELMLCEEHTKFHIDDPNSKMGVKKILDYEAIKDLRTKGLGYKKIAKALNYPQSSVKSAIRKLER